MAILKRRILAPGLVCAGYCASGTEGFLTSRRSSKSAFAVARIRRRSLVPAHQPRCRRDDPFPFLRQTTAFSSRRDDQSDVVNPPLSIAELLDEVNKRGLRYSPTTSRQDLERMLEDHDRKARQQAPSSSIKNDQDDSNFSREKKKKSIGRIKTPAASSRPSVTDASSVDSLPVAELLQQLDQRGIRYLPATTPQELRQLLAEHLDSQADHHAVTHEVSRTAAAANTSTASKDESRQSLADLLRQLDDRGIRYPPTATRQELLQLLLLDSESNVGVTGEASLRRQKRRMRRDRLDQQPSSSSILGSFLSSSSLPKTATKRVVSKAIHKAKTLSRQASDYLFTDDDGVRDVAFVYVQRDDAMALRLRKAQAARKRKAIEEQTTTRRTAPAAVMQEDIRQSRLPPASGENSVRRNAETTRFVASDEQAASKRTQPRKRSPPNTVNKRIYSPYGTAAATDAASYKDGLDLFGDFLADSADKVMWGSTYDTTTNATSRPGNHHPDESSRHWKDRLEERFDYMLGIHNDGAYYNSWTKKVKDDQNKEGGWDSLSVARGRKPKRRGVMGRKKNKNEKALWEQDNLLSLLFGRSQNGNSNLFDKILSSNGSILNLFTAVFKSGILIASYLCRWASCRGALPQPIVVVGMSTALISARPRYRLRIAVMVLIGLRAVGELLHGYVYGDDGWEDDSVEDDDDDGDVASREKDVP